MSKQSISEINGEDSELEGISLISDALESETSVPNQLPDGETSEDDDCDIFESKKFKLPKLVLAPNINRIGRKKDNLSSGSTTSSSSSLSTSTSSSSSSSTIMVERKNFYLKLKTKMGPLLL